MNEELIWQNAIIIYLLDGIFTEIKQLNRRDHHMADELAQLQDSISSVEADVQNVLTGQAAAKAENEALRTQIADLQAQIAAGSPATAADLNALTARADAVNVALDSAFPDPPNAQAAHDAAHDAAHADAPAPDPAPPIDPTTPV